MLHVSEILYNKRPPIRNSKKALDDHEKKNYEIFSLIISETLEHESKQSCSSIQDLLEFKMCDS